MAISFPDLKKSLIPSAIDGSRFRLLFAFGDLLEVRVLSNSPATSTAILAFLRLKEEVEQVLALFDEIPEVSLVPFGEDSKKEWRNYVV